MKKKKCHICNNAKGKRGCKLNNNLICSRCCAEKRDEACIGCSYYKHPIGLKLNKLKKLMDTVKISVLDPKIEKEVNKALALLEKSNFDEGKKILDDLEIKYPDNYYILYGIGTFFAAQENNETAIFYYEKSLNIFPYFLEAIFNLGACYLKEDILLQAILAFKAIILLGEVKHPAVIDAQKNLKRVESYLKAEENTNIDDFIKSNELYDKALSLMKEEKIEEAIECFEKSIKLYDQKEPSFGNLAICYAKLGQKKKAIECLDKALAIEPEYQPAIYNKIAIEKLAEGEILDFDVKEISYGSSGFNDRENQFDLKQYFKEDF